MKNSFFINNIKKDIIVYFLLILLLLLIFWWYSLPQELFDDPCSTVVETSDGQLLIATVAENGQWKFPPCSIIPPKFFTCLTEYEDKRFLWHNGVDVLALLRAGWQNLKHRKIHSGGSTISMQVVRLYRKQKKRTLFEKIIEIMLAIRLELMYNKYEIFLLYMNNAPFGGNVIGLEAAAWRYFGIPTSQLSWAQAATLAVLPNSPSLIYPGKNKQLLEKKRNKLLFQLYKKKYIDSDTYHLAIAEPLPNKPNPMPNHGSYFISRVLKDKKKGQRIYTTIKFDIQAKVQEIIDRYVTNFASNAIYNSSAIIIDVSSGKILAYVGNTLNENFPGLNVDMNSAIRSPGSTLKPLLYCAMLKDGTITPEAIVPDIPVFFDGFHPQNVNRGYEGAVKASDALARSLNVPAVFMLKKYNVNKFHFFLNQCGLTTITKNPSYYGLALILGGCEVRLDELTGVYASMARILNRYNKTSTYNNDDVFAPIFYLDEEKKHLKTKVFSDAGSIWYTFEAMKNVQRPDQEKFWQYFSSSYPIAWKTGTSYGNRDAWAIGVTPQYAVGVWVGNVSGMPRDNLTGINNAAPILFEIFQILPTESKWFEKPSSSLTLLPICKQSGYKVSEHCCDTLWLKVPPRSIFTPICPYHKFVYFDSTRRFRVYANCYNGKMFGQSWFSLPPAMEHYYSARTSTYRPIPELHSNCQSLQEGLDFEIIYPIEGSKIRLISPYKNKQKPVVFRAAHKHPNSSLYWYINKTFLGKTYWPDHQIILHLDTGNHILTLIDNMGKYKLVNFKVEK